MLLQGETEVPKENLLCLSVFTSFGCGDILFFIKLLIKPITEAIHSCRFNSSISITWDETSASISWIVKFMNN
jgi:hypothetical protein